MNRIDIKWLFLSGMLATGTLLATADDSIPLRCDAMEGGRGRYEQATLANPALKVVSMAPSQSVVSLAGVTQPSAKERIPQLGNGGRFFQLEASSFQHLNAHSVVWGHASYTNGKKYDVVWNETSDLLRLYPYVMADSRGGDMKYEEYQLSGGYAQKHGKLYYGLALGYRALSEYRDRDPRPNNTVADLYARVGVGYGLWGDYILALAADAGKYKQTNELAYYNELGAQMEYHLTGVGTDFSRFSGQSNNVFFKGYDLGMSLDFARNNGLGWAASAGYLYTKMDKVLSDLNRLPLNRLQIHCLKGSVGFSTAALGVRVSGKYASRQGKDNLFGDATGSIYPQIGSKKQYKGTVTEVKAEGFWNLPASSSLSFQVCPEVAFEAFTNHHATSDNRFDADNMLFCACGTATYTSGRNRYAVEAGLTRRQNLSTQVRLYRTASESLATTLQHVGDYFEDGETLLRLGLSCRRTVWGNKAVAIALQWHHDMYLSTSNNRCEAKVSFYL